MQAASRDMSIAADRPEDGTGGNSGSGEPLPESGLDTYECKLRAAKSARESNQNDRGVTESNQIFAPGDGYA
jgi:hypothetical protein